MVILASLSVWLLTPALADPPPQPAPVNAAKLREAQNLLEEAKYGEAIKAFKEADKLANGACVECHLGMARAYNKLGAFKNALKSADAALKAIGERGDKPALIQAALVQAYNERAIALVEMGKEDPTQLEQAEKAFRQALEQSGGKANAVRFSLAVTLLRLSRDAEGVSLLKEYLERDPNAPSAEIAKDLIANPLRARKRLIPDFELATLAGDYLTAEELKGKVLLLDFWGTWCGPCRAAIPGLRSLSRRMKDDPFVLLSISTDSDESALRDFISKNEMTWPQVWDKDRVFTRKCGVERFPTYVVVSSEGEIVHVVSGWGDGYEQELADKIRSALRSARKSAKQAG
jgi:peroxiredoxin